MDAELGPLLPGRTVLTIHSKRRHLLKVAPLVKCARLAPQVPAGEEQDTTETQLPYDAQNENSQWIVEYITSFLPLISDTAIRNKAEWALDDHDGFSLLYYEVFPKNRIVCKRTIPAVNINDLNMRITNPSTMDPDKDFYCLLLHSFSLLDCADGASAGSCRLSCAGHDAD